MTAFLTLIDSLTEEALTGFDFGDIPLPTAAAPTSATASREYKLRNTGTAAATTVTNPIQLLARPFVSRSGDLAAVVVVDDEVSDVAVINAPVVGSRRAAGGEPVGGVYEVVVTQVAPSVQVTVGLDGGGPGAPITVTADGATWNANVITGVELQFASSGLQTGDTSEVRVIQPKTYRITFRDNVGTLQARVDLYSWGDVIADGVTRNILPGVPGIEWVISNTVSTSNAATRRGTAQLFNGGRFLQVSADDNTWARSLNLDPADGALVPYSNPYAPTGNVTALGGTIAAGTYRYAVTGRIGSHQSLINEGKVLEVELIEDDAIDIGIESTEGGYTSWNIWRATGAGSFQLLADGHDFIANPTYTDDGSVTPSGGPPSSGQELTVYLRMAKNFPASPSATDRAAVLKLWDSY